MSRSIFSLQLSSYLSKYLILHMLNYYPIQREHQTSAEPELVVTGQKVAIPEPLLGTYGQAMNK